MLADVKTMLAALEAELRRETASPVAAERRSTPYLQPVANVISGQVRSETSPHATSGARTAGNLANEILTAKRRPTTRSRGVPAVIDVGFDDSARRFIRINLYTHDGDIFDLYVVDQNDIATVEARIASNARLSKSLAGDLSHNMQGAVAGLLHTTTRFQTINGPVAATILYNVVSIG